MYYAVAEFWSGNSFDLWIYPNDPGQYSIFGDLVAAPSADLIPTAAAARLQQAGWRVTSEWRPDGDKLIADVELSVT
jgi:hypothetical protein